MSHFVSFFKKKTFSIEHWEALSLCAHLSLPTQGVQASFLCLPPFLHVGKGEEENLDPDHTYAPHELFLVLVLLPHLHPRVLCCRLISLAE